MMLKLYTLNHKNIDFTWNMFAKTHFTG